MRTRWRPTCATTSASTPGDTVESPHPGTTIHFVKALGSSVLGEADMARIRAAGRRTARVFLHQAEGGHWLNTENPGAIHELLAGALG